MKNVDPFCCLLIVIILIHIHIHRIYSDCTSIHMFLFKHSICTISFSHEQPLAPGQKRIPESYETMWIIGCALGFGIGLDGYLRTPTTPITVEEYEKRH
jgi:hypothetical protein